MKPSIHPCIHNPTHTNHPHPLAQLKKPTPANPSSQTQHQSLASIYKQSHDLQIYFLWLGNWEAKGCLYRHDFLPVASTWKKWQNAVYEKRKEYKRIMSHPTSMIKTSICIRVKTSLGQPTPLSESHITSKITHLPTISQTPNIQRRIFIMHNPYACTQQNQAIIPIPNR